MLAAAFIVAAFCKHFAIMGSLRPISLKSFVAAVAVVAIVQPSTLCMPTITLESLMPIFLESFASSIVVDVDQQLSSVTPVEQIVSVAFIAFDLG